MIRFFPTTSDAYQTVLKDVLFNYQYQSSPRGMEVRELLDYSIGVSHPSSAPIVTADLERNKKLAAYLAKEKALYDSRTNSAELFGIAASLWKSIQNPDGTINSAYGKLIWSDRVCGNQKYEPGAVLKTPWLWAQESLLRDKDTRQAIMHFNRPEHLFQSNRDVVCTLSAQFFIRDEQLHLSVHMRSNDAVRGFPYDVPWFCSLMDKMLVELKPTYPELQLGSYRHHAGSMHLYRRDWEAALDMIYAKPI